MLSDGARTAKVHQRSVNRSLTDSEKSGTSQILEGAVAGELRMQREVEALYRAFHDEKSRETRLIQDVLSALAVGAASRRMMIEELAAALARAKCDLDPVPANVLTESDENITSFVNRVRTAS